MSTRDITEVTASAYSRALMFALSGKSVADADIEAFLAQSFGNDLPSEEARAQFASEIRNKAKPLTELDPLVPEKHFNPLSSRT